MLAMRMTRHGTKKRPFYHIVVADSRSPRDGRFIEKLGTYNPMLPKENPQRVTLVEERVKHWLKNGAQPSDRVATLDTVLRTLDVCRMSGSPARALRLCLLCPSTESPGL